MVFTILGDVRIELGSLFFSVSFGLLTSVSFRWSCFALGRPRSVPVLKDNVPMPKDQPFLQSMANLSRIISKCMDHIYAPRHDSVLPVWKYANEIRVELRQFAEQLPQTLGFDLRGDVMEGELGICQTMLSTSEYLVYCFHVILTNTAGISVSPYASINFPSILGSQSKAEAEETGCHIPFPEPA